MDDLQRAARLIAQAQHIAVLTGAGVSAESGIPTFRGFGGLWRGRDPMSLATPEAFAADPALVWDFYNWRRQIVREAAPNPAHIALAELAQRVPRLTLITQNVDRLHQRAGSRDVLELHGNLGDVRCVGCGQTTDRWNDSLSNNPRCTTCGARLRPAVVWFGEALPPHIWTAAERAVIAADTLLVIGTSAVVYPAAGLATLAKTQGRHVVEINLEPTPLSDHVGLSFTGHAAGAVLPQLVTLVERGKNGSND